MHFYSNNIVCQHSVSLRNGSETPVGNRGLTSVTTFLQKISLHT